MSSQDTSILRHVWQNLWLAVIPAPRSTNDWLPLAGFVQIIETCTTPGMWKKFEPLWGWGIAPRQVAALRPALETILAGFGHLREDRQVPGEDIRKDGPESIIRIAKKL